MEKSDGNASHIEEDEKEEQSAGNSRGHERGRGSRTWSGSIGRRRGSGSRGRGRGSGMRGRGSRGSERGQGKRGRAKMPTETAGSSITLTESDREEGKQNIQY